ncbi:putative exported protein [Halobacteriovorax marinus SJ]|uniref:Exported protein n=1 Tax=Halobacteriovorax marinus (strain ATCC BAA-682 / DSM 15412 / SJ) TaxID=862908 RepID=E1X4D2_HALMS|nr:YiiX/YebB-like N1pC/P60 family cysteine hydrolase [Halobacteriovorax marinus]CBW27104.1 putative exported protein [Halobacteriovorax marinus SJ]
MQKLIFFLLLIISTNSYSSELNRFEDSLEQILSSEKEQDAHLQIYQHTLNLGAYGLEYLWTRTSGNGQLLNLIRESWEQYLASSEDYLNDLSTALNGNANHEQALRALQLIERTQSLYDTYMKNKNMRYILLDQSAILNNRVENHFNTTLSVIVNESIPNIIKQTNWNILNVQNSSVILTYDGQGKDISEFAKQEDFVGDVITDFLAGASSGISSGFGALAGPIEWGDGGQLRDDLNAQERIYKDLMPLDIIFEKKAYKLTDYTIPGYWGHNAVWLGTQEQLKAAGLWDAEELAPFRKQIEKGYSIFEMRKWGTTFDKYSQWMNLDDFAQIRVKGIESQSKSKILKIYKILGQQIGKNYDFAFNADTAFKITCSEIIYLSYGDVSWPLERILGRNTITPNAMAEVLFYENSPVEFINFVKGNRKNGAKFHTKEEFANVMNFVKKGRNTYHQNYRSCKLKRVRINRRGYKLINHCVTKTRQLSL